MCLNVLFARGLEDAIQLCGLIDVLSFFLIFYNTHLSGQATSVHEELDASNANLVAAAIGCLAAAMLFRFSHVRPLVQISMLLAMAATLAYLVVGAMTIHSLFVIKRSADALILQLENNYWIFADLQVFVIFVIAINHALLAHFARILEQRQASGHAISAEDVGSGGGPMVVL